MNESPWQTTTGNKRSSNLLCFSKPRFFTTTQYVDNESFFAVSKLHLAVLFHEFLDTNENCRTTHNLGPNEYSPPEKQLTDGKAIIHSRYQLSSNSVNEEPQGSNCNSLWPVTSRIAEGYVRYYQLHFLLISLVPD